MKDLAGQLTHLALAPVASISAAVDGTGVDLQQFHDSVAIILDANNVSGTTPTLDAKIQDSPDNTNWTDVAGATFTTVDDSASKQTLRVHTREVERYIRVVLTPGGTSPIYLASVNAVGVAQTRT